MPSWAPLVPRRTVAPLLADIAGTLKRSPPADDPGLLTGQAGTALFFLYYARFTGSPADQAFAETQVGELFATLPDEVPFTFCSGIAGIAWLLRHAAAERLLDVEPDDPLSDIDVLLRERMVVEMRAGRFDFLHGALGCALYVLEAPTGAPARQALIDTLAALEGNTMREGDRAWWRNPLLDEHEETRGAISLGLSHGIPSVISLLDRYAAAGIEPARATALRDAATRYLLAQALAPDSTSRFPAVVPAPAKDSRLAWCYGDPGVTAALWQAGERAVATAVIEGAASRRDDTGVVDLSLCHGSAGLALIFARMHQATGSPALADAARYWHDDTLARLPMTTDLTLLTGLAGAGLALMALGGETAPSWDRALLLS